MLLGRTFVGPLGSTAQNASGLPSTDAKSAILAAGDELASGATSATHVAWHRPSPAHTGGLTAEVVGYDVAQKFWVLRSRRD